MVDPQKQMQDEAAELQMWQEVAQLAQSGTPDAMPKIAQIAAQAIPAQEAEMKEMQTGGQPQGQPQNPREQLKAALIERAKQQQAPQQGDEQGGGQ